MKKLHICLLGLALMAMQCEEQLPSFELEKPFSLQIGEQKMASGAPDMIVHFTQVTQDSRCPTGVNCVWEGEAVAELVLGKMGADTLALTYRPGREKASIGRASGYSFRLLEVKPYPEKGSTIEKEDYELLLEIKKE
ncbi:MAG: hypothetical protein KTR30_10265 [Saprospiraceae bacterium]|nr:hypothetical protein [Saprospiraceae bacterium]